MSGGTSAACIRRSTTSRAACRAISRPIGIDGAQRRLLLLGVDAELRASLLRDHRQGGEHPLAGMVVETLERERGDPRSAVDVGRILPLDGLQDQVVRAGLDAVADDFGNGRLDQRRALNHELGPRPLQHEQRRGVAVERRLGAQHLIDLGALLGDACAPLLDLISAFAVREPPVVEDLAALAEVLVAFGDDRLPALDCGKPLVDLLHGRLVGVQGGGPRLGDQCGRVLGGVGKALTHQGRLQVLLRSHAER